MTFREQILQLARVRLDGPDTPFKTVDRARIRVIELDQCPACTVYPGEESVTDEDTHGRVLRTHRWRTALRTFGDDTDLDQFHQYVTMQILSDGGTFGGLALKTDEVGTEWVVEEGGEVVLGCDIEFETQYYTNRADQERMG